MSTENSPEQGVNQEAPVESPVNEAPNVSESNPPAESNSASPEPSEKGVPYPRFKEVIDLKNQYEGRIRELESRLTQTQPPAVAKSDSLFDNDVNDLVAHGMDEASAKILVRRMASVAERSVSERVDPIVRNSAQKEVSEWTDKFKASHKDYDQLEPKMYDVYKQLDPGTQEMLVSNPKMLEFLYSHAKVMKLEADLQKKYEEGQNEAYKTQRQKSAMSGTSGSSPKPKGVPTPKEVGEMSLSEYMKNRDTILANLNKMAQEVKGG